MRLAAVLLLLAACAPDRDLEPPEERKEPDAGEQAACDGTCRDVTLTADFAGKSRTFDRVQFGLTAPGAATGGAWELYLEAHAGGAAECPSESSPSPDMTLVLTGLVLRDGVVDASGAKASFLDFSGELVAAPIVKATAVSFTSGVVSPCIPGDDAGTCDERLVSFELDATFDGGTLRGHGFATHCASLDEP